MKTYCLLNIKLALLTVALQNDGEVNFVDPAKIVKTFRELLSSLRDY